MSQPSTPARASAAWIDGRASVFNTGEALLRAFHGAPLGAPLASIFPALAAMDVIDHPAAIDKELQHLAQRRLVVKAPEGFRRSSICDRLRDAENDRCADAPDSGAQVFLACLLHLTKSKGTCEEPGEDV